jgi:predicted nucleotidyltransferase
MWAPFLEDCGLEINLLGVGMSNQGLKQRAIYVTRHGSHAYGLNTATSDLDIKGVLIAEPRHYLGFLNRVEQIEEHAPNDLVIYELAKFFRLASDCNPNIIEVLHTDPSDVLYINGYGEDLRKMKDAFLSQKAKHTFSGYAMAQLKRMRNHHEWMKNPPAPPKDRSDLGLPSNKNWCDGFDLLDAQKVPFTLSLEQQEGWLIEQAWREDSRKWANYQEWLAGRNPARHANEVKFGYDTKHGMHLVRLLRMGTEILTTGKVLVKRPDAEELLAIRNNGLLTYEEIVAYAESMDSALTGLYNSGTSPLPKEPDRKALDELCVRMIQHAVGDINLSMSLIEAGADNWGTRWDGSVP